MVPPQLTKYNPTPAEKPIFNIAEVNYEEKLEKINEGVTRKPRTLKSNHNFWRKTTWHPDPFRVFSKFWSG
jgi:hypothetical protein